MNGIRFSGGVTVALFVLAGGAIAGVNVSDPLAAADKPGVAAATPVIARAHGSARTDALVQLHRSVTGGHVLQPVISETAGNCCVPNRAAR